MTDDAVCPPGSHVSYAMHRLWARQRADDAAAAEAARRREEEMAEGRRLALDDQARRYGSGQARSRRR
ncbi:MAG: hypothetical protein ACK41C_10345 [Phenylobacterium sp.]|uniref:hypothetical protein n=1 Tax=Phenylobacterium sp. TaxID=1871053 RepID=UPI00391CCB4C